LRGSCSCTDSFVLYDIVMRSVGRREKGTSRKLADEARSEEGESRQVRSLEIGRERAQQR
jgi:hypothetical protein